MQTEALGRILERAIEDVFATMLATQLERGPVFENAQPLLESEVTSFIGLAGAFRGYVALHASREQCRDFTARLLGADRNGSRCCQEFLSLFRNLSIKYKIALIVPSLAAPR